ncbi:MAG: ribonuclease J [Pseudomonadota bacterium]
MTISTSLKPDSELIFLPLGGSGEIGMNMNLYGYAGKWLMVDCGIAFGDERHPGIDILMADPGFIEERRDDLVGLVLTHAHEDHLGALPYLWPRLGCPIYATPFTAAFLRLKLRESDFADRVEIIELPLSGTVDLDPFSVELVSMTHSIPEPSALAIRTPAGLVVHSGDWKLDPDPLLGDVADEGALRRLGDEGVLALVGDSTNALEPGVSGSEADVRRALTEVIGQKTGRVAVTCFSSNVVRLNSVAHAAHANGRHCALVGRSLWRIHAAATETGYIDVPEPFLNEHDAGFMPNDKVVLVVAGSQGEPRSAMTRIAHGDHPDVVLEPGDCVIYSARDIPGNEKAIGRVQNALAAQGVEVITPDEAPVKPIHVSGHPAVDELTQLYQWLRPAISIPVHGEMRHMKAHAALAKSCQVPETLIPGDGAVIRLAPGPVAAVDHVPADRLGYDGGRLIALTGDTLRTRHRLSYNGAIMASLVIDPRGRLAADPGVTMLGLEDEQAVEEAQADLSDVAAEAFNDLPKNGRLDVETVREAVRRSLRRAVKRWYGKKPVTEVHVVAL